jgi:hypothetical protein
MLYYGVADCVMATRSCEWIELAWSTFVVFALIVFWLAWVGYWCEGVRFEIRRFGRVSGSLSEWGMEARAHGSRGRVLYALLAACVGTTDLFFRVGAPFWGWAWRLVLDHIQTMPRLASSVHVAFTALSLLLHWVIACTALFAASQFVLALLFYAPETIQDPLPNSHAAAHHHPIEDAVNEMGHIYRRRLINPPNRPCRV